MHVEMHRCFAAISVNILDMNLSHKPMLCLCSCCIHVVRSVPVPVGGGGGGGSRDPPPVVGGGSGVGPSGIGGAVANALSGLFKGPSVMLTGSQKKTG